ncbi:MAG: hypothetical protein WAM24_05995, partial [Ignavibacteriaceae bacterium]
INNSSNQGVKQKSVHGTSLISLSNLNGLAFYSLTYPLVNFSFALIIVVKYYTAAAGIILMQIFQIAFKMVYRFPLALFLWKIYYKLILFFNKDKKK